MSLVDLMRKGSLPAFATVTAATVATREGGDAATVAVVATVAVAKLPDSKAANDPAPDPDRWCWPHSDAMTGAEIDRMVSRIELFAVRGLNPFDATALSNTLVMRDRDGDDRCVCLECSHFSGGASSGRCSAWRLAGIGGAMVPGDLVQMPQRCNAFKGSIS